MVIRCAFDTSRDATCCKFIGDAVDLSSTSWRHLASVGKLRIEAHAAIHKKGHSVHIVGVIRG